MSQQHVPLRIGLAQMQMVVGDLGGNTRRAVEAVEAAAAQGAQLVVLPELALLGYPPDDLLLRPDVDARCRTALEELLALSAEAGIVIVVGSPVSEAITAGSRRYNAGLVLAGGGIPGQAHKRNLPNYGVFDEKRYFTPGEGGCVVTIAGHRVGVLVCEDVWLPGPAAALRDAGADLLVSVNASPYHCGKHVERREVAAARTRETGLPLIYVNGVGGQDDLVFDGNSFAMDAQGREVQCLPSFRAVVGSVEFSRESGLTAVEPASPAPPLDAAPSIYGALTLAVHDYIENNGFPGVIVGLSGGIDSALTLAVAVDALGPERVTAVMMPSRYTAQMSLDDAAEQAARMGVQHHVLSIEGPYEALLEALAPVLSGYPRDVTEENLQARCRGNMLMALSNKTGALVLATGNKSEMAVGYATLYGDMTGGFAPLKDVSKTRVYELARWRNGQGTVIPERVIQRAPSAELAEDQADTDSLPAYDVLDPVLEALVERDDAVEDIVARGHDEDMVRRVARMLVAAEYKRRQAAPGPKVTRRAFGRERRYPVTSRYPF